MYTDKELCERYGLGKQYVYVDAYEFKDDVYVNDLPFCLKRCDDALKLSSDDDIIRLAKRHYIEDLNDINAWVNNEA